MEILELKTTISEIRNQRMDTQDLSREKLTLWSQHLNKIMVPVRRRRWHPYYSCLENPMDGGAWWAAVHGIAKSQTRLSDFTFTFHCHALEKEMATHSSVLAWRIPGVGEPGGLPSMGSHRVRHDWSDLAAAAAVELDPLQMLFISKTSHMVRWDWFLDSARTFHLVTVRSGQGKKIAFSGVLFYS